jgi:hypothetical protein
VWNNFVRTVSFRQNKTGRKGLLFDPVLGNAAPLPFMVRRYDEPPIKREDLPDFDYYILFNKLSG